MGVAENHGDKLTYWVLDKDDELLAQSVVHLANSNREVQLQANKKVRFKEDEETKENIPAVDDADGRFGNSRVRKDGRSATNQTSRSVSVSRKEQNVTNQSCDTGCNFPTGTTKGSKRGNFPIELDLLSDMGGPCIETNPTNFVGYNFIKPDD